jgi:hypothetical protein
MTRVYLHIGAPKTGTTYLQNRLAANRTTLSKHQVSYPAVRVGDVDQFRPVLDLMGLHWQGEDPPRGQWKSLVSKVRRSTGTVIVSHEMLSAASEATIERVAADLHGLDLHVVYSARDLGRQIPAAWQESIKQGKRWSFAAYLRRLESRPRSFFWRSQDVRDVLTRWGAAVPTTNLHLVTVPPAGAPRAILLERLCAAMDLRIEWMPKEPSDSANTSMGIAETNVVRRLNKRLARSDLTRAQHERLVKNLLAQRALVRREDKQLAALPPEVAAEMSVLENEWIDWVRTAGIDVVGDLSDLRPDPIEGDWTDPDRPRPKQVLGAALDALAALTIEMSDRSAAQRAAAAVDRVARRWQTR